MENLTQKTIESKTVYRGPIFHVEKHKVELPNKKIGTRDIVVNPNACAIVALDNDMNVIMVYQYRDSAQKVLAEIPAGKIDGDEDPFDCAKRELQEETGYISDNMVLLFKSRVSLGFSTEIIDNIYIFGNRP